MKKQESALLGDGTEEFNQEEVEPAFSEDTYEAWNDSLSHKSSYIVCFLA